MTLKELRMWHWERALEASATMKFHYDNALMYQRSRLDWNTHMGAVQALNDVLPGTAEQDCANAELEREMASDYRQPEGP